MKTPDEIKKGLVEAIEECAWVVEGGDAHDLQDACEMAHASMADALALIQQLQTNAAKLTIKNDNLEKENAELLEKVEQLQAERDAMKALFVDHNDLCAICKHQDYDDVVCSKVDYCCELCSPNCACHGCVEASHYEWLGVQKEG